MGLHFVADNVSIHLVSSPYLALKAKPTAFDEMTQNNDIRVCAVQETAGVAPAPTARTKIGDSLPLR